MLELRTGRVRRAAFGIRDRIMLWLLILGILPVVLVSLLGHLAMSRAATRTAGERLLATAIHAAGEVDSHILDVVRAAGHLSGLLPSARGELARALAAPDDALPHPGLSRALADFRPGDSSPFRYVLITDRAGRVLASIASGDAALPVGLARAREEAGVSLGGQARPANRVDYLPDEGLLEVVAPIADDDGSGTAAFLCCYSDPGRIFDDIDGIEVGRTGFASLLSGYGEIIAVPASAAGGRFVADRVNRLARGYPLWYRGRGLAARAGAVVALAPVAAMSGPGRPGWVVSVEQSAAEVLSAPHQFGRTAVLVVLLTTGLVMLVGTFLSKRIVRPLRELRDGVSRLANGSPGAVRTPATGDEIEELADEFSVMAEKLARSQRDLEHKVREATSELAERNASLEAVLGALSEGLMVLSSSHRILLWNRAAEKMTGYAATEVAGRHCADLLGRGDGAGMCKEISALAARAEADRKELRTHITTRSGARLPVSINASPLPGEDDRPVGYVVVLRDITKEQELDRLKSDMVSMVSHELRTPLGPLIGFAELLLDRNIPEDKRSRYLHIIIEQGRRLSGLIDNFLTLSQIEAGKFALHLQETDLYTIALEVISLEASHNPKHDLVNAIPPGFARVVADPDRVKRVMHNLVSNAIKYSPQGGSVEITARDLGQEVEVSVNDEGIGIRSQDIPLLFQQFSRVNRDALPEVRGTGLGLSICRRIVEEHGGTIGVESVEGSGSRFLFRLPKLGPDASRLAASAAE